MAKFLHGTCSSLNKGLTVKKAQTALVSRMFCCRQYSDVAGGTSEVLLHILERKLSMRGLFHLINRRFGAHGIFVLTWDLQGPKFQYLLSYLFSNRLKEKILSDCCELGF